jgi:hypothetical protein
MDSVLMRSRREPPIYGARRCWQCGVWRAVERGSPGRRLGVDGVRGSQRQGGVRVEC